MAAQYYSCDLNTTPSRKRKRQSENIEEYIENSIKIAAATSCFTNAAFSSTPRKIIVKRCFQLNKNKEEPSSVCPEGKSIVETNKDDANKNPFEVIRKPPKKKKRHTGELSCFENPALNIDYPEKLFNPYEVIREVSDNKKSNCFTNAALNLKVHDASILCNPFEVQRQASSPELLNAKSKTFSKNPFIISPVVKKELTPKPCQLKLGLPFAPKLGCRVDFKDVAISQLTPSKLLAEKLVFSPVQKIKLSLDSIGEESPMDIGKELDRYQLELENSINEAKLQKTGATKENVGLSPPDSNYEIKFCAKQKPKFIQTLYGIPENFENKPIIEQNFKQTELSYDLKAKNEKNTNSLENSIGGKISFQDNLNKPYQKTETAEVIAIENLDELYGCCADDKEDSMDFKSPAPFVRAYTTQEKTNKLVSKDSMGHSKYCKSDGNENDVNKLLNVKNIIRKSIRKIVHAHPHGQQEKQTYDNFAHEKQKGFMNAIRSSFRRKPSENLHDESEGKNNISIIDCSERTMKLKTDVLFTEYGNVDDLTNERKPNLRNSIRKSTREVRSHIKSVFHKKHDEYNFRK